MLQASIHTHVVEYAARHSDLADLLRGVTKNPTRVVQAAETGLQQPKGTLNCAPCLLVGPVVVFFGGSIGVCQRRHQPRLEWIGWVTWEREEGRTGGIGKQTTRNFQNLWNQGLNLIGLKKIYGFPIFLEMGGKDSIGTRVGWGAITTFALIIEGNTKINSQNGWARNHARTLRMKVKRFQRYATCLAIRTWNKTWHTNVWSCQIDTNQIIISCG